MFRSEDLGLREKAHPGCTERKRRKGFSRGDAGCSACREENGNSHLILLRSTLSPAGAGVRGREDSHERHMGLSRLGRALGFIAGKMRNTPDM